MKFLYALFSSLILATSLQAEIINVPADQPTIQAGINAATDGDTVLVADSTYTENINYLGKAITVASHYIMDGDTNHIANTVINGSEPSNPDSGSVVYFISGEDTTSVLKGFTITGGSGTKTQYVWQGTTRQARVGGGIFCYDSGARISWNIITNNTIPLYTEADGGGIGVATSNVASPPNAHTRIDNNKIITNVLNGIGSSFGSGILFVANGTITNNNISFNTSNATTGHAYGAIVCPAEGSAPLTVTIKDNQITHNVVNGNNGAWAGGILVEIGMSASIIGNTISDNQLNSPGSSAGGGIRLLLRTGTDIIDGNIISDNVVAGGSAYAGGIMLHENESASNTLIINNIISGNSATFGGGIRCLSSKAQIINNTIVDNTASVSGGGIRVEGASSEATIMNTILWGNSAPSGPQISATGGTTNVRYSDVEGGWPGEGNIDLDPQFADTTHFYLANGSPCIDAGNPDPSFNDPEDPANPGFALWPAMGGLRNDMGAYGGPGSREIIVGIEETHSSAEGIPDGFQLYQNYPNPFNPGTTIEFALAKPGWVTLKVYNVLGQKVAELVSENLSAGSYKYDWNAGGLASGVYYYRLEADHGFVQTKKMLLIR